MSIGRRSVFYGQAETRDRAPAAPAIDLSSALEGVFDLLPGLLQIALGLIGLTLSLKIPVVGGVADALLDLPLQLVSLLSILSSVPTRVSFQGSTPLGWCGAVPPQPA